MPAMMPPLICAITPLTRRLTPRHYADAAIVAAYAADDAATLFAVSPFRRRRLLPALRRRYATMAAYVFFITAAMLTPLRHAMTPR